MIPEKLSESETSAVIQKLYENFFAQLQYSQAGAPFEVKKISFDLTSAKLETAPYKIGFPFTSFYVVSASDSASYVEMKLDTTDSYQDSFKIFKKDCFEMPGPKKEAYLFWPAQSNKTIEIVFFVTGKFRTGSNVTEISSSVSANSRTAVAKVTVLSSQTALLSTDLNRKLATIWNEGSDNIYVGPSGADLLNDGIPIPPNGYLKDSNTSALYGLSSSGIAIARIQVES